MPMVRVIWLSFALEQRQEFEAWSLMSILQLFSTYNIQTSLNRNNYEL